MERNENRMNRRKKERKKKGERGSFCDGYHGFYRELKKDAMQLKLFSRF